MANSISAEKFIEEVVALFDETFERSHGIYLDRGTSLFETLETITAEMASMPVSDNCATLAAQVEHVNYYLEVLIGYTTGNPPEKVDWKEIWNRVSAVTPEEWTASKERLRESYQRTLEVVNTLSWEGENDVAGVLAIVVHTAYHLGEIRQALCRFR